MTAGWGANARRRDLIEWLSAQPEPLTPGEIAAGCPLYDAVDESNPVAIRLVCGDLSDLAARDTIRFTGTHPRYCHMIEPYTEQQLLQLTVQRARGWTIEVRDRRDSLLLVEGTDASGERFVGQIDQAGRFAGEPVDPALRPARFGVGAPIADTSVTS